MSTSAAPKTGGEHIDALRDGRTIILDGAQITNHVDHPAFANAVRTGAALYDLAALPANVERMTFASPTSGRRVSRAWQLPANYQELVQRREALDEISRSTFGWVGRTPDHVASALSAMLMSIDLFERHGPARAAAVRDYFTWARDNDVWCGYAIVPSQIDRLPPRIPGEQADAAIVDEDSEGITVKGSRQLSTGLPMAQELLVAAVRPLKPGQENVSFTAMVPLSAKGLKLISRRSYEAHSVSPFDFPLSSRYDENDSVVYFDEVKIPWERVFIHNDVEMARAQWFDTPLMAYQNYPAQVRLSNKLAFLVGLAHRMAQANGSLQIPGTQEALGQMAAEANQVRAMVLAMEVNGTQYGEYFIPDPSIQYSAQVLSQQLYPKFITRFRELAGGSVLARPSSHLDLTSPSSAEYIERTQGSGLQSALDRVKLFNLAWDAVGSEFASRHTQYEMFYAGPTVSSRMRNFGSFDWEAVGSQVDAFLAQVPAPG
jgi:4-hydroxyphenylacetate 3-monooxygenase